MKWVIYEQFGVQFGLIEMALVPSFLLNREVAASSRVYTAVV
jgi:hypothetical protein